MIVQVQGGSMQYPVGSQHHRGGTSWNYETREFLILERHFDSRRIIILLYLYLQMTFLRGGIYSER